MRSAAVAVLLLATACGGASGSAAPTSPAASPSANRAVLVECQQIAPLLGEVSDALDAGAAGTLTEAQAYDRVEVARKKIDAFADTFTARDIAVNAHGVADRIGVALVSLRRGDDDPEVAVATVGTATDDFLAACHRVAGG